MEFREHRALDDTDISSLMTELEDERSPGRRGHTGESVDTTPRSRGQGVEVRGQGTDLHALTIERVKALLAMPPDQVPEPGGAPNPMYGHAENLTFCRVTGHPDYVDVDQWFDASECWICERWNKCSFRVANCHAMPDKEFTEIIWLGALTRGWA